MEETSSSHFEKKYIIQTENNKKYDIYIKSNSSSSIKLEGYYNNNLINENYSSIISLEKIKENKYFLMFDTIDEILNEISFLLEKNNSKIIEENDKIILNITLITSKIKEINFTINKKEKNESEKITELYSLINNIDIKYKNEINELKNIINKQNEVIKSIVIQLFSLDSLIIGNNEEQNKILKTWINPNENKNMKSKLLYRLTRDGNSFKIFHEKCDNQGPTLILIKGKDGRVFGGYTPLSWDSTSRKKCDLDSFLFSLTDNKKYPKKNKDLQSIDCYSLLGPWFYNLGFYINSSMNQLYYYGNIDGYQNANDIIPNFKTPGYYDITEVEIFQINMLNYIIYIICLTYFKYFYFSYIIISWRFKVWNYIISILIPINISIEI